jgi:hypothetical protein
LAADLNDAVSVVNGRESDLPQALERCGNHPHKFAR